MMKSNQEKKNDGDNNDNDNDEVWGLEGLDEEIQEKKNSYS